MKTNQRINNSQLSITIDGHITGMTEVIKIKDIISSYPDIRTLELIINDAFVIPSALIGYLVKLFNLDKTKVIIKAQKSELKHLLSTLKLDAIIEVR